MKPIPSFFSRKKYKGRPFPLLSASAVFLCLLSALAILPLFSGCSTGLFPGNDNRSFRRFTGKLFQQEVASNTISLHYTLKKPSDYGLLDYPITYGNFSTDPAAAMASVENCLAALRQYDHARLSDENRLTYNILESYLETASEGAPYLLYQEPLSPVTGIHAQLPVLLSEYQFYTEKDVDTYLQLLGQTGNYFNSMITFEKSKSSAGLFMADYQADSIIEQCNSFIAMGDTNYLYTTFEERLLTLSDLPEEDKNEYLSQNKELIQNNVFPAYSHLIEEIEKLKGSGKNENGLCHLPEGKEFYEYVVRLNTGISEEIPELKEMTRKQIIEDLTAMEKVLFPASSTLVTNPGGSPKTLHADSAAEEFSILEASAPSAMLDDLKGKISNAFPEIPSVSTNIKYVPDAMEEYLSPAFYMIPAIDNISENVIYINQGQMVEGLNLYTTLAHEGYPGHLYQTVYFASRKTDPIRSILDFGGYVEGWATYAEMMSYYLAPLSKDERVLLQKNSSVLLGLYALADIGIHYDGWTLTDTTAFYKDYGITDTATIQRIYQLIVGDPGNYLKYYLGYLKFLELKKEAADRLQKDFSQKEFHKAVLDVGPAPFDIVEAELEKTLYK